MGVDYVLGVGGFDLERVEEEVRWTGLRDRVCAKHLGSDAGEVCCFP